MWSTYLFHVRSGNIGPRIHFSTASWDMTINETETFSGTLIKSSIPTLDSSNWLEPWWAGVVLMWNNTPIFAGPITARPKEGFHDIQIACAGIRELLATRMAVRDMDNWENLKNIELTNNTGPWDLVVKNLSYPSIARTVVETSLTKHGGDLPIDFMVPKTTIVDPSKDALGNTVPDHAKPHYRRFMGNSLLNESVDVILQGLSDLDGGPDIMFRPVLRGNTIRWQMWTGYNDELPEIYQDSDTVWDTTAPSGYISELELSYTGKGMTNRSFTTADTAMAGGSTFRMSQDTAKLNTGWPLMESMEIISGQENEARLASMASANLKAHDKAMHQLTGKVRADGINEVGTFWPGEYGTLVTSGWYGLKSGVTRAKILSMSGDLSTTMSIGFKETEVQ